MANLYDYLESCLALDRYSCKIFISYFSEENDFVEWITH